MLVSSHLNSNPKNVSYNQILMKIKNTASITSNTLSEEEENLWQRNKQKLKIQFACTE
jgi:hypothetical protein